ncbi:MAG: topoisomerase DNA-binding C4 zinc finger domain-containing protein, partial [Clostridia bacterium]|nr:topoisomerase DNA-binding C4 zinc finger domain-containing protein [Clostridia bacterium]
KRQKERVENGLCPICAGKLVVKEGRYGRFYGCSNYPSCTYRKNIKDNVSS